MLYDDLPPAQAVAAAWLIAGPVPEYHHRHQAELQRTWPVLAHHLDRLAEQHADDHHLADATPPPSYAATERAYRATERAYRATRTDIARTGRLWLTATALGAWAAAAWLGTTTAWVALGAIGTLAALGAIGAHRDTKD